MPELAAALRYAEQRQAEWLAALKELLRIPSVSTDPEFAFEVRAAADWVAGRLKALGLPAKINVTSRHPIVTAERIVDPARPTLLFYGHYDVQPPGDPAEWITPAFEPDVRDGNIYCRGTTDDKGQLFTQLCGLEAWIRGGGGLPLNVKVLIDGEEEIHSENLPRFIERNRGALAADCAVICDSQQYAPGMPAITYGLKGLVALEFIVRGPRRELHSGLFGGSVANPLHELAGMIARLHDADGRVSIPGFYDDVAGLEQWERDEFAALPFSEAEFLEYTGAPRPFGEAGYSTLERCWARPTLELNGMWGGYTGEGGKTIVPPFARAKITLRLVPDQQPQKIHELAAEYLRQICPDSVRLEILTDGAGGAGPVLIKPDGAGMRAARRAIEQAFAAAPKLIRNGGTIPVALHFQQLLGIDSLLLGWGLPDDNLHAPNEKFSLAEFARGTRAIIHLLDEFSRISEPD